MVRFKSVRSQIVALVNDKLQVPIDEGDIAAAHELKLGRNDKVPPVIVRFSSSASKQDVMFAKRRLPDNVYINDQLTALNGEIFREARKLRTEKKIDNTWTKNGQICIKLFNTNVIEIKSLHDLAQFNVR